MEKYDNYTVHCALSYSNTGKTLYHFHHIYNENGNYVMTWAEKPEHLFPPAQGELRGKDFDEPDTTLFSEDIEHLDKHFQCLERAEIEKQKKIKEERKEQERQQAHNAERQYIQNKLASLTDYNNGINVIKRGEYYNFTRSDIIRDFQKPYDHFWAKYILDTISEGVLLWAYSAPDNEEFQKIIVYYYNGKIIRCQYDECMEDGDEDYSPDKYLIEGYIETLSYGKEKDDAQIIIKNINNILKNK